MHTSAQLGGLEKKTTDSETAQLKNDDRCIQLSRSSHANILNSLFVAHPTAAPTHKIITPSATTLSPSLHQLKSVRSGQPTRHGPRTSTIFSRIKPPTRRRKRLPGLIRNQVNIQSTHTPPKLLHLPHNFLDTEMPLRHIRKHRVSRIELIITTRV